MTNSDWFVQVSWDHFDADMQSPLSVTSNTQSPITDSNSMSDYSTTFAGSSTFHAFVPKASRNSTTGSEDGSNVDVDNDSKIKVSSMGTKLNQHKTNGIQRRRIQNRNSQRAYRERTKLKEEQMASVISKLQAEIDALRRQEKDSTELIESLTKEVERLKKKGLVLHYQPSWEMIIDIPGLILAGTHSN